MQSPGPPSEGRGYFFSQFSSHATEDEVLSSEEHSKINPSIPRSFATAESKDLGPREQVERLAAALPLIRSLRSTDRSVIQESRPYDSMHPAAFSTHLVTGSFFGPKKFPISPYYFTHSQPTCRIISVSYIGSHLCGHPGFVHGGLLSILFDDIFARCASVALPSGLGMTANLSVDYMKPSLPDRFYIIRANILKHEGRKVWIDGEMRSLSPFQPENMMSREVRPWSCLSIEEEEGEMVAKASALFIEPKFVNVRKSHGHSK